LRSIVTLLVTVWGVRLGGFLLYRVILRGKDARFDEMRSKFWSFLGFWIFQIVWVWVVHLPGRSACVRRADAR
jgi:steroid 5-alpha reductase family enzyme